MSPFFGGWQNAVSCEVPGIVFGISSVSLLGGEWMDWWKARSVSSVTFFFVFCELRLKVLKDFKHREEDK